MAAPEQQDPPERPAAGAQGKEPKSTDTPDQPTAEELATQKVQNAPLGLADPAAAKKTKQKGEKTRLSDKPKTAGANTQPYLGQA